jgi:putative motility protein YjfB-like
MSTLSVASISAQSQQFVADKVSMAVAKKSLDVAKSQGDAAVSLIQSAASIAPGQGGPMPAGRLDVMG